MDLQSHLHRIARDRPSPARALTQMLGATARAGKGGVSGTTAAVTTRTVETWPMPEMTCLRDGVQAFQEQKAAPRTRMHTRMR